MLSDYWRNVRMIRRDAWIVMSSAAAFGVTWTGISGTILNLYLLRMGYGPQFVGISVATAALGYALFALPAAAVSRKLGSRRAMIVGIVGWIAGMVALSLSDSLPGPWRQPWILGTRLFATAGLVLHEVSQLPFLTAVTSAEERPHAFALLFSLNPLGAFLGSLAAGLLPGLLAGVLGTSLDQPRPYGYVVVLGLLVHLPVIWALSTLPEGRTRTRQVAAVGERSRVPYALLGVIGLISLLRWGGEYTARIFFNVYMDQDLVASAALIGASMALANLLTIPAPLVTPPLIGRLGRVGTIIASVLGVAASLVLLGFSGHWALAATAFVGMSALSAMSWAVWTLVSQEVVEPAWRSISSGVYNLASGLGVSAMSVVGGYMAAGLGYRSTFTAGATLVGLGALVFWTYFRVPRGAMALGAAADVAER